MDSYVPEQGVVQDTVNRTETPIVVTDTVIKISKSFQLNTIWCYWKHTFVVYGESGFDLSMELRNSNSDSIMFEFEHAPKHSEEYNYKAGNYFEELNREHFKDVNFDGFKDFTIYLYGSMPMTSQTDIFIFNKNTGQFEIDPEEDLSDTVIEELDSINRILVTSGFNMEATHKTKYHFDRNGKIKFTEKISEKMLDSDDANQLTVSEYEKYVKGKLINRRTDTLREE